MTSTSCDEIAREVLARAVAGNPPRELPRELLEEPCGKALFGILVEGLADRFEPALCDVYADLFAQAVDGADAKELVARYRRVRHPRAVSGNPRRIFVLSRVTLGADVAVTSVMLDAAKRRFPEARIGFVGPRKNFELFAADRRIAHVPLGYTRGGLRERLAAWGELRALVDAEDAIVIDPDSRLTQLGLLPVCAEDRYYFFESRAFGGAGTRTISELSADWASEVLGVSGAKPYVALEGEASGAPAEPYVAVSLGVGENPAKRIPDPFEKELLAMLGGTGLAMAIDRGAGGEEAERVERAVARSGASVTYWDGSFAGFARVIAGSRLYVGYDSAGQHVAAACGVPLITVFAGFPVERMFQRWRPSGERSCVIRVGDPSAVAETLRRVRETLQDLFKLRT